MEQCPRIRDVPFMLYHAPWFARAAWGAMLCAAYPLLILTPLAVLSITSPTSQRAWIVEVGVDCAVVAFTILAFQFVISARLRWIEAPFGLDVVLQFHRTMALAAVGLLCIHVLLIASGESWGLLTRWRVRWPIWVGRLALLILFTHVAVAIFRGGLRLRYEMWRRIHNIGALLLLGLPFVHSLATGHDFESKGAKIVWSPLPLIALSAWTYGRWVRTWMLERNAYRVVSIDSEAPRVWTITVKPTRRQLMNFAPGQFQFLRPLATSVLSQEHPFSIASSPSATGQISLTIKECGDFTSTIGHLQPGDLASIHGPFGRFSHVFHPDDDNLVFVAAGVGITPLMSMLRYMRDRADPRPVLLIYANRSVADIVFRRELESIESSSFPALKTVHILAQPPADWVDRRGRLDTEHLRSLCGSFSDKVFYICCPTLMMAGLIRGLRKAGVDPERIHADYFGF